MRVVLVCVAALALACGKPTSTGDDGGGSSTGGGAGGNAGGNGGGVGGGGGSSSCGNPSPVACTNLSFAAPVSTATTNGPIDIRTADMNGDGTLDVVTAHAFPKVSITPGDCSGGLGPASVIDGGTRLEDVEVADLNGDGRPDVATSDSNSNAVWVYLNSGGQLAAPVLLPAGSGPFGLAAADVSGDGLVDLVASNNYSGTLSVFINQGGGTFSPARTVTSPGQGTIDVAIGDINRDGREDLAVAVASGTGAVGVFFNRGDGGFSPMISYPAAPLGNAPDLVALADLNRDGWLDVAATHRSYGQLGVFLGRGDGGLAAQKSYDAGSGLESLRVADLNGDGALDAVVTNGVFNSSSEQSVSVLLGNGDGTFRARQQFTAGPNPRAVDVADLNGDGRLDLVVGVSGTHVLSVFTNNCTP